MRRSCKTPSCRFREERQAEAALACVIAAFDLAPRARRSTCSAIRFRSCRLPVRHPMALRPPRDSWMTVQPLADACGLANAHARARAEGQSPWRNEERLAACILDLGGPKPLD